MVKCERCNKPTPDYSKVRLTCYGCGRKLCFLCRTKDFGVYWCDSFDGKTAEDCREHAIRTAYVPMDER